MPGGANLLWPQFGSGNWTQVGLLSLLVIFAWEVIKGLAPKAVAAVLALLRRLFADRRHRAAQERAIRRSTSAIAQTNWIGCLPALSRLNLHAPVEDIYQPMKFRYEGLNDGLEATSIDRILMLASSFAVVGPPGSGKSALASMLANAYAKDSMEDDFQLKDSRLPLLVALRQLPPELGSLPELLSNLLQAASCHVETSFLTKQLALGRCVLVLDGLDETGDQRRRAQVVQWLVAALAAYPKNRFIVTCRTNEWETLRLPGLPTAHILPLGAQQCEALVERWARIAARANIGGRVISADALKETLRERDSAALGEFSSNPLMLTIMLLLALRSIDVHATRSDLYLRFIRTLLGEWDRIKGSDDWVSDTEVERRLHWFQRLAGHVATSGGPGMFVDFSDLDLASIRGSDANSAVDKQTDPRTLIAAIGERSGLLVRSGEGGLAFASRALFEVLVARDLLSRSEEMTALSKVDDPGWSEIAIHVLELCSSVQPFLISLRPTESGKIARLKVYGRAILEADARGQDVDAEVSAFANLMLSELSAGRVSPPLCALAWHLRPEEWKSRIGAVLDAESQEIPLDAALRFLSAVDVPETINMLRQLAQRATPATSTHIADALGNATCAESMRLLWDLTADEDAATPAAAQLARRGSAVIDGATAILNSNASSPTQKTAAINVLARIGDATALAFLLRFARGCEPQLHFAILQTLHQTHFAQFGRNDAERIVDAVVGSQTLYVRYGKRILDVVVASSGFLMAGPIVFITALAIKLTSPGPMFFLQMRVGKDGKSFALRKFRTMFLDAEAQTGTRWASYSDPRITPIGRWLRKLRLDEVPQLLNVIRGELSMVGPRPELPSFVSLVRERLPLYAERVRVAPGITGLAQLEWQYGSDFDDTSRKLVLDLYYVSHCSLLLDVKIMWRTASLGLSAEGAR